MCFYFLYNFCLGSHSNKNFSTYVHKFILVFMWSTCYSRQILRKLKFSQQIFEKYSNMTIRPVGGKLFRVDGHDEANSCFLQFCECA